MAGVYKRRLTPESLPPAKRTYANYRSTLSLSFDQNLSDELVLHIFSYLPFVDLCVSQSVNHHWARLATDNQLWKALFLSDSPLPRLRGSKGYPFSPSRYAESRNIKPLPSRSIASLQEKGLNHSRDWKWMYRIRSNWEKGRCRVEAVDSGNVEVEAGAGASAHRIPLPHPTVTEVPTVYLAGDLVIASSLHEIRVYSSLRPTAPRVIQPALLANESISTLSIDQSSHSTSTHPIPVRFASFSSSGSFHVFSITRDHTNISDSHQLTHSRTPNRRTPIMHAAYHHPLLVTLSATFQLSIYTLPPSSLSGTPQSPTLKHTVTSFTSFPPASLTLTRTLSAASPYKLTIAYTAPVYPAHWSAAVAEISMGPDGGILSSRNISAVTMGWGMGAPMDEDDVEAVEEMERAKEQWGRKLRDVVCTESDGKWVVLAGGDNTLQVYRLQRRGSNADPRLMYQRVMLGHTASIAALKVADGRCVSAGRDGCVWVWDLEEGWGVEVPRTPRAPPIPAPASPLSTLSISAESSLRSDVLIPQKITFDERKIVCAFEGGRVESWRFDI
ncbi:hypothetical protein BOTBODRAFT_36569 [Botryobasidium botryosum FD-172 SS1]|uniref:F-box domain-containing protein n=1 Tax=Botryobasidium botryosum (strain FD-172 SS1) TaxID=930990 RepID=A0A067ME16_BOTB1|nr:hypothetical protein BOTBODRAFT_36569 [Botryobasidium botryosum FD-172 SS1]